MTGPTSDNPAGAVALIGMAARFPGAPDAATFWENLRDGVESISRFDEEELRAAGVDEILLREPNYVPAAAVLDSIERFDAEFFGFRESEAETMDPQQRIFLECAWEAMEDAGYAASCAGPGVGVFAGASISTYLLFNLAHRLDASGADFNLAALIGNDKDYLATMTAYKHDLRGPTVAVQTACSTSLVAVHLACQALIDGECDMALAGGVTVRVPHRVGYLHQGGSMLSRDGHCRAFDARAAGTAPGSGAGVVVLKRLADALADRDSIRAVVLGSAINNDGAVRAGFTAPTVTGQASVIATAHAMAGIDPRTIGYIEAHGTGTHLGDPIEIEALTRAFGSTDDRQFCAIGSVKTNVGHLECAAGVAGLIKTVLALQHKQIPPSLHFERPNEQIDFGHSPVYVNAALSEWPAFSEEERPLPRRAGVSSFGFGGANCHVVLEEAPAPGALPPECDRPAHLLTLSARSESALAELSARYVSFLRGKTAAEIPDICYTANVGRQKFAWRRWAIGATAEELTESLCAAAASHRANPGTERPRIAFLFPEGPVPARLARILFDTQPSFRTTLEHCDEVAASACGGSFLPSLTGGDPEQSPSAAFAVAYALAELWRGWGVEPEFVSGYGVGEFAAACFAGVLTLESGLRLAAAPTLDFEVSPCRAGIRLVGSRTGAFVQPAELVSGFRQRPPLNPVQCRKALETIRGAGGTVFLEMGTGALYGSLGGKITWVPIPRAGREWHEMIEGLGKIYCLGGEIDWPGFDRDYARRRVPLPTYPFQRKRYWVERPAASRPAAELSTPVHPSLGRRIPLASGPVVFEAELSAGPPHFLADHRVRDTAVFPMTAYLEAALAAAKETFGNCRLRVESLTIDAPLTIRERETCTIQVVVTPRPAAGEAEFDLFRKETNGSGWRRHAAAVLRSEGPRTPIDVSLERARVACREEIPVAEFYRTLREAGMEYGPLFRGIQRLYRGEGVALARVELPFADDAYLFHPALADACLQAAGTLIPRNAGDGTWLPVGVDSMSLYRPCRGAMWSYASTRDLSASGIFADVYCFDDSGELAAEFRGLRFRRGIPQFGADPVANHCYETAWRRVESTHDPLACLPPGTWLVWDDGGDLDKALKQQLTSAGARCIGIGPEDTIDRSLAQARGELLAGAVHLRDLRATGGRAGCATALQLSQALLSARRRDGFHIWLVTRGAQRVDSADSELDPMQALTWGFGRVLANEHPELGCMLVDAGTESAEAAARMLLEDFAAEEPEEQIAYRGGIRFTPRLTPVGGERTLPEGPSCLPLPADGLLANLRSVPAGIPAPGPGEVGIRVRATSLNFKDVLNAMGMFQPAAPLGSDCAGEIYAVGPGVEGLVAGQRVVAVAPGSFASHAIAPADFTAPIKPGMSFEDAAAAPTALLTAHRALFLVGRLKKGQKILIHAGAGGVGLAAVRMALDAGAEVFATAGSPEKRRFLTGAGVSLALDSRSLEFSGEVLEATGGHGVDLVLNSLNGKSIAASFAALAAGGRFLEIGRIGIWDDARAAGEFPHVSYHRIALDELMTTGRSGLASEFREVVDRCFSLPVRLFPLENVADAFRYMQGARHIGKIVVTHPREIRADATYVIAGGLGALGLGLASALADRGARTLALAGRHPAAGESMAAVENLRARGVRVEWIETDVTKREDVSRLIESLGAEAPIRGIVHAAGVLDDGAITGLTWDCMEKAMAPKVAGAWNLHLCSRDLPLDFFILYSSAAALLGPPGQASYAAGNSFLDALAHYRHSLGLPCLSVNWGPWRAGMAMRGPDWESLGLRQIEPEQGHAALDRLLKAGVAQAAVISADWPRLLDRFAGGRCPNLFRELRGRVTNSAVPPRQTELRRELEQLPAEERMAGLRVRLRAAALQVLGRPFSKPLPDRVSLIECGMDSLMTVEFRNALDSLLGARLPSTLVFDYPTIEELSAWVAREIFHWMPQPSRRGPERIPEPAQWDTTASLDDLSEEQLVAWIGREAEKWSTETR